MNTTCRRCKANFVIDVNDETFYRKMKVPNPTECPDCRLIMRVSWRNETSLYSRVCDMCEKSIISVYNPKSAYTVYCNECYRGEKWDSREYALEYDCSKPFFEQLQNLFLKVPKNQSFLTLGLGPIINSPYNNGVGALKDCYFCFNSANLEDSSYNKGITYSREVYDSYFGIKLDQCYETVNVQNSNKVFFAQDSLNCVESFFLYNCSNLINCFGCVNLRNKSNCWFNEQLSVEEYNQRLDQVLGSYLKFKESSKKFEDFKVQFPRRNSHNINTVDCIGDYLSESKNNKYSFEVIKSEDCKWVTAGREIKDSYGVYGYGIKSEKLLECVSTGFTSNAIGCYLCEVSQDIFYSFSCFSNNKNIFGCDSLKNSKYCILNMQYEEDEYEKIKNHIVNELTELGVYGLMLPPELCPFGYNETVGNDLMPLTKEEVLLKGFKWQEDIQKTIGKETLLPENISDNIQDIPDTITQEILKCIDCERNYKITEQELFFYQKMKLPIPRKCFFCRHHDRIEKRGPYKFWKRNCDLCQKDIETNFAPERPEIIYCEDCYRKEVL